MLILLLVVATFLGLVHLLLYRRLIRATQLPPRTRTIATAGLIVLWVLAVMSFAVGSALSPSWSRPFGYTGALWLGVVFYLVLGTLVIALASGLLRIVRADPRTRLLWIRASTAVLIPASLITVGLGAHNALNPVINNVTVDVKDLPPEFEGLRVAVFADLHVGPTLGKGFTQKVVQLVQEEGPDLILIPGDLIDGTVHHVAPDIADLASLSAPLGVFVVSGNHEYYADDVNNWLDHFDSLGMTTLRNSRVASERGDASIDIVGVHDWDAPEPDPADLSAALDGADPSRFSILVAHQPHHIDEAAEAGINLQVSGHTHGGQMWPFNYAVKLAQSPRIVGLDSVGDAVLYTTPGVGTWGPPVRVGNTPEVAILELR
ncbi:metallophosphoesterase [Hoyosella rhizosphaerae]|nr:metallophosphoesterase [Hoyosella rhizosphaerae]